jgi:glycosyltransferase 2 family protein
MPSGLRFTRLLRIVVALGLTSFVLWKSGPSGVLRAAAGADLTWLGGACALVIVDRVLMAYRWWILLCAVDAHRRPPLAVVIRIFFVSTFVGTFLPSVGGDVYRAYSLARHGVRGPQAAGSVLMDRLLGVLSMVIMAAAGLTGVDGPAVTPAVIGALVFTLASCALAFGMVFSERLAAVGRAVSRRIPLPRLQCLAVDMIAAIRRFADARRAMLGVLTLSIAVQVLRILQAFCLGRALSIALPPAPYFAFIPVIVLVMQLPVTIAGLGTGNWAFVTLFSQAGATQPDAFALSVLFIALGVIGNLPGAVLYAASPAEPSGATSRPST